MPESRLRPPVVILPPSSMPPAPSGSPPSDMPPGPSREHPLTVRDFDPFASAVRGCSTANCTFETLIDGSRIDVKWSFQRSGERKPLFAVSTHPALLLPGGNEPRPGQPFQEKADLLEEAVGSRLMLHEQMVSTGQGDETGARGCRQPTGTLLRMELRRRRAHAVNKWSAISSLQARSLQEISISPVTSLQYRVAHSREVASLLQLVEIVRLFVRRLWNESSRCTFAWIVRAPSEAHQESHRSSAHFFFASACACFHRSANPPYHTE